MGDGSQLETDDLAGAVRDNARRITAYEFDGDVPLAAGSVFGAAAFLLSYLVAYATTASATTARGAVPIDAPGTWKIAAWSHLTNLGVSLEAGGERTTTAEVAALVETQLEGGMAVVEPNAVTYLLPLVVLAAAGYGVATYCDAKGLEAAAASGVAIVPAVLVCSVTFAVLSTHSFDAGGDVTTIRLLTGDAILSAGIVYPATFGICGALLAVWPAPVDRVLELFET